MPCIIIIFSIELGVPPQLMNVEAQLIEATSVKVTWNEPSGTPTVTFAAVTYCPQSSPDCRDVKCTISPCTIEGLMPNTTYNFSFTPNNNCGVGSASSKNVSTYFKGEFTFGL